MKRISLAVMIAALGATGVCRADTLKATLFEPTGQLVGFAVWYTDNAEPAADINIPDLGMTLNLHLRHNAIELAFKLSGAFPHGGIASVPGMLTKNSETDHGLPLTAMSRKIGDNLFTIEPTDANAERQRNLELMRRTWLDVPIVFTDGKRAILAVEKGDATFPQ
jgi:hypothetical protein